MIQLHYDIDATVLASLGAVSNAILPPPDPCSSTARAAYVAVTDGLTYGGAPVPIRVTFSTVGRVSPLASLVNTVFDDATNVAPRHIGGETPKVTVEILAPGVTFAECAGELGVFFAWHEPTAIEGL